MKTKTAHTGKFKSKGSDILKAKSSPSSMNEFLEDNPAENVQMQKTSVAQLFKTTEPQTHNHTNVQNRNDAETQNWSDENKYPANENAASEAVERIHVHIRKDLADKLIEMVYDRKREGKVKKREASQRHIIEQALEEYFAK
jgi:cytochrome c556